jgi:hypothetical protein
MTSDVGLDPTYKSNLLCYPDERSRLTFFDALELKEEVVVSQQLNMCFPNPATRIPTGLTKKMLD